MVQPKVDLFTKKIAARTFSDANIFVYEALIYEIFQNLSVGTLTIGPSVHRFEFRWNARSLASRLRVPCALAGKAARPENTFVDSYQDTNLTGELILMNRVG